MDATRRRSSSIRLSIILTAVVVGVLGTVDHAVGANAILRTDGECGRRVGMGYVGRADIASIGDLTLPVGARVAGSCLVDRESLGSSAIQLDAEARVPRGIDTALLAQHFIRVHDPTNSWDLPANRPHWISALHRLHDIRFFTNKLRMGENAGTYVIVGVEPHGSLTLVADLLGGSDNL